MCIRSNPACQFSETGSLRVAETPRMKESMRPILSNCIVAHIIVDRLYDV